MSIIRKIKIGGITYDLPSGGSGTSDYSQLTNKPQINGNTLNGNKTSSQLGLASASDIPTKVSDLTNDSGFITGLTILTYGSSTWNDFITAFNANKVVFVRCGAGTTPGASTKPILAHLVKVDYYNGNPRFAEFRFDEYVDQKTYADQDDHIRIYKLFTDNGWTLTTVPVAPKIEAGNDLTYTWAASGRERTLTISLDNTLNDLTNYYTKSNTYTKTEVDNLIGAISTISFEIVQTLPTTNIKTNVIYLVPKSTAQTNNTYDEYINTTGTSAGWEKIGDTAIDLSGYYKTSDTAETDLADGDYVPFYDTSATAKRKTLWSNIKAKLKTYFDGIYATISSIGNGKLTIQKNGTDVATFTANQSGTSTANISVPTTADDVNAVKYDGNLTSLGLATPAAATKTYFDNNVANNKVEVAYNTSGDEYTILFSRGGSAQYGNILKYGYADKYLRILRKKANTWQSTDWEKISAGYADTAGSINWGNITGTLSSQVDLQNELNNKQAKLVSGTNIKTINGQSVLGSGNITISAGGATWGNIGGTLTDQTDLWLEIEPRIKLNTEYTDPFTNNTLKISEGHVEISASPSSVNKARLYWNRLTFEHTVSSTTTSCEYWETGVKLGKTSNGTTTMVYLGDTVLWTNPSPTASFSAQTVTLSKALSNFDYFIVICTRRTTYSELVGSGYGLVGRKLRVFMCANYNYVRNFSDTDETGTSMTISDCSSYRTYGSSTQTTDNGYLIPYKIIGFKFHN